MKSQITSGGLQKEREMGFGVFVLGLWGVRVQGVKEVVGVPFLWTVLSQR